MQNEPTTLQPEEFVTSVAIGVPPYRSITHEEHFVHQKIGPTLAEYERSRKDPRNGFLLDKSVWLELNYALFSNKAVSHVTYFIRKEDDGLFYYATAYCSVHDQFNRKTGRTWARRHYFEGRKALAGDGTDYKTFVASLFEQA